MTDPLEARVTWVVPCYNEAERLDPSPWVGMLDHDPALHLRFVDDGSRDATREVLDTCRGRRPERIDVLALERNRGKAEAVRRGLLASLDDGEWVGFADADLATPPDELARLATLARSRADARALIGARVALAGRHIERKLTRHYLGRVFSTAASIVLRERFYDTQCGAKLFRADVGLRAALADPFESRWAFDVELLGRLLIGAPDAKAWPLSSMVEVPLHTWVDVPGSKVRPRDMVAAARDLWRIERRLRARRRAVRLASGVVRE